MKTFPNNYYVKTGDEEPFCLFHYQITVKHTLNEPMAPLRVSFGNR